MLWCCGVAAVSTSFNVNPASVYRLLPLLVVIVFLGFGLGMVAEGQFKRLGGP